MPLASKPRIRPVSTSRKRVSSRPKTPTRKPSQADAVPATEPIQKEDSGWRVKDTLDIEEFNVRNLQAQHWRGMKMRMKAFVAQVKSERSARKFEGEVKLIGQ
jgi:hypothetical protein